MSWSYYRDAYTTRRGAVEAMNPEFLKDPQVALALTQIAVAEAALDAIIPNLNREDDYDD